MTFGYDTKLSGDSIRTEGIGMMDHTGDLISHLKIARENEKVFFQ